RPTSIAFLISSLPPPPPTSTLFPYTTLFRSPSPLPRWPPAIQNSDRLHAALRSRELAARRQAWDHTRSSRMQVQRVPPSGTRNRSEEHTSELQSRFDLVCRLLLEKKKRHAQR